MKSVIMLVGVASLSVLSGCATVEQTGQLENRVGQLENQVRILETRAVSRVNSSSQPDTTPAYYCYMNGVRYTEGATTGNQQCQRTSALIGGDPRLQWRTSN